MAQLPPGPGDAVGGVQRFGAGAVWAEVWNFVGRIVRASVATLRRNVRRLALQAAVGALPMADAAQTRRLLEDPPALWDTPEHCRLGTLRARKTSCCFGDADQAARWVGEPRASRYVVPLDGLWGFELFDGPEAAMLAVREASGVASTASRMRVPAAWQREGWDNPVYTNIQYPIPITDPPRMPKRNPTAVYTTHLKLPRDLLEQVVFGKRRVILHFAANDNATLVSVDGKWRAWWTDARLPGEVDVTDCFVALRQDPRLFDPDSDFEAYARFPLLNCLVLRWSCGAYLEDQDAWKLSGILRQVRLVCPPIQTAIYDLCWRAEFPGASTFERGESHSGHPEKCIVHVQVTLQVALQLARRPSWLARWRKSGVVRLTLHGSGELPVRAAEAARRGAGEVVACVKVGIDEAIFTQDQVSDLSDCRLARLSAALPLARPALQLWSSKRPYLYTLVVELLLQNDGGGPSERQIESCYVGLRSVSVGPDGVLRINAARVVLAGVNRHEHDPARGGISISDAAMEDDARMLRRGNFNAVRCSHYPAHPKFYALCDRAGLYVIDEANVETHGMQPNAAALFEEANGLHEAWRNAVEGRAIGMVLRDRTHPCVIAWSLGNEAGYEPRMHDSLADKLRSMDGTRLVVYEPASWSVYDGQRGGALATDALCPMYARVEECLDMLRAADSYCGDSGKTPIPLFLCEYAHAMGNSVGNLQTYWTAFRKYERFQGGFIWDLVDQGLRKAVPGRAAKRGADQGAANAAPHFWAYGGDFGELPTDSTFCINGLLLADRARKPAWFEACAIQKPFGDPEIVSCDAATRTVQVRLDSHLERRCGDGGTDSELRRLYVFAWELSSDFGEIVATSATGGHHFSTADADPFPAKDDRDGGVSLLCVFPPSNLKSLILTVRAVLHKNAPWAKAGFEVGIGQVIVDLTESVETLRRAQADNLKSAKDDRSLDAAAKDHAADDHATDSGKAARGPARPDGGSPAAEAAAGPGLKVERKGSTLEVRADGFCVGVDAETALPSSWKFDGVELLDPPAPDDEGDAAYLDELPLKSSDVGYGDLGLRGRLGYEGRGVFVQGVGFSRAVSAHSTSKVAFDCSEEALARLGKAGCAVLRLRFRAALNDSARADDADRTPAHRGGACASVSPQVFQVSDGAGRVLWTNADAPLTDGGQSSAEVSLDVSDLKEIVLTVKARGGEIDLAHAVWLDPVLSLRRRSDYEADSAEERLLAAAFRFARSPVRLQLDRGWTCNDRGGYLEEWKAFGVDEPLVLSRLESLPHDGAASDAAERVDGSAATWHLEPATGAVVLRSKLVLRPRRSNRCLLALRQKLDHWLKAAAPRESLLLTGLSDREAQFAKGLAAARRLAVADVGAALRVTRPAVRACTTHLIGAGVAQDQHGDECDAPGAPRGVDGAPRPVPSEAALRCSFTVRTTVTRDGSVRVAIDDLEFGDDEGFLAWPPLPRIGLVLRLATVDNCEWVGLGPHEAHADRRAAAARGRFFASSLDEMAVRYVRPQESGNRHETRRVALRRANRPGAIRVTRLDTPFFDFSIRRFSTSQLAAAQHAHDLAEPKAVQLNLDARLMGCGGDDSWTACVHDAFLVPPPTRRAPLSFEFELGAV